MTFTKDLVIFLKIIFIDIILTKMSTSGNAVFLSCENKLAATERSFFAFSKLKIRILYVFSQKGLLMDEV